MSAAAEASPAEAPVAPVAKTMTNAEAMRHWDLTAKMAGYWNCHLMIPMLSFVRSKKIYDEASMQASLRAVLEKTAMEDRYSEILPGESPPQAVVHRWKKLAEELPTVEAKLRPAILCFVSANSQKGASGGERKSIAEWSAWWKEQLPVDIVKADRESGRSVEASALEHDYSDLPADLSGPFLRLSQIFYEGGAYANCERWLDFYLNIVCELTTESRDSLAHREAALWGITAVKLLRLPAPDFVVPTHDFGVKSHAFDGMDGDDIKRRDGNAEGGDSGGADQSDSGAFLIAQYIVQLDNMLDVTAAKKNRETYQLNRSWLIHWAIWPLLRYYFPKLLSSAAAGAANARATVPHNNCWAELLDWLFSERNVSLLCFVCPHVLRYLSVIAVLNKHRQDHFKVIVEAVGKYSQKYSDPFTSILESLFVKYDFDQAQKKLVLCSAAAEGDFFLAPLKASIEEHSRLLIFETYCRIQKSINIDMIAQKLHMTSDIAERWIVNLIRQARLEAKIDSERNRVEIATQAFSVHQQVIERTRNLTLRANVLLQNLDRPSGAQSNAPNAPGQQRAEFRDFRRRRNVPGGPH